ncbi:nodulation protein NfeD, partial [candidate division KSB1 bacterium]|nr:nodulation protein NfeD [candidate division KSB1 bacterium]
MKRDYEIYAVKICIMLLVIIFFGANFAPARDSNQVDLIQIAGGTINPISADFIIRAIDHAEDNQSQCLIIELDTPGGLITATQDIVKRMLASNIPLVVFVYPSGSGAVSAGVSITIAAHFAVMAPGTNIGAAHPVG